MKKTELVEIINKRWDDIIEEMAKADADAYRSSGAEFRVYIDTNGEIGTEEWIAGDNGYFRFRDPDYDRYYLGIFCYQNYDVLWDWWFADTDEFRDAFIEQFGTNPISEDGDWDNWADMKRYGSEICKDAGIEGFDEWIEEQRDEAIDEAIRMGLADRYYGQTIIEAFDEMEF